MVKRSQLRRRRRFRDHCRRRFHPRIKHNRLIQEVIDFAISKGAVVYSEILPNFYECEARIIRNDGIECILVLCFMKCTVEEAKESIDRWAKECKAPRV